LDAFVRTAKDTSRNCIGHLDLDCIFILIIFFLVLSNIGKISVQIIKFYVRCAVLEFTLQYQGHTRDDCKEYYQSSSFYKLFFIDFGKDKLDCNTIGVTKLPSLVNKIEHGHCFCNIFLMFPTQVFTGASNVNVPLLDEPTRMN
jgi:hypothetical protein